MDKSVFSVLMEGSCSKNKHTEVHMNNNEGMVMPCLQPAESNKMLPLAEPPR